MVKHRFKVLSLQLAIVGLIVLAWQVATLNRAFAFAVAPPSLTAHQVVALFREASFRHALLVTGGEILSATAFGVPCAAAIGFALAALPSKYDHFYDNLSQLALTTPQSVLLPVFMFIFGVGFTEIVIVGITHLLFVVMLNARVAAKSIPPEIIKTSRYYGAKTLVMIRKVYIPHMMPTLMQAVRLGFVFAITGVLVAQLYSATGDGIGVLIDNWSSVDARTKLTAAVIILTIFAVTINQILFAAERRYTRWLDD